MGSTRKTSTANRVERSSRRTAAWCTAWAVATTILAGPTPATAQTAAGDELSTAGRSRVEEIVVHARKRDELLVDTPISVTAIGSETLQNTGITRLDEVQNLVPNMTFYSGRAGQTSSVFIRGIGQENSVITFDPGVGIYVDGVFLARQQGSVLAIVDFESVEVLRGPQGTLFGKNTVGGAINITTAKPHDELEGNLRFRTGEFGRAETKVTLNVPLIDETLAARFTASQEYNEGYTRNLLTGRMRNDTNALAFMGALRWTPTENVDFVVRGMWSRDHNNSKGGRCMFVNDTGLPNIATDLGPGIADRFYDACRRSRPFRFSSDQNALSDVESYGAWGNLQVGFGDVGPIEDLSMTIISSWREQRTRIREDGDGTEFQILHLEDAGGDDPLGLNGTPGEARQVSQELQINGAALDGALHFVSGLYGYWEDAQTGQAIRSLPGAGDLSGATSIESPSMTDNWSWAIYTQATFDVTEWLSLTGGIRYTEEKKGFFKRQINPFIPDEPLVDDLSRSAIFTDWTPTASIALTVPQEHLGDGPIDHFMTYFTYSNGFKGGGFNGNARSSGVNQQESFRPETIDSFEMGIKTILFDNRLTGGVAVFKADYDDLQVATIEEGVSLADLIVRNAAKATTKGVELELEARPIEGLAITASAGWLDAIYDEFISASTIELTEIDRSGDRFNNVPKFQSRVSIQYTFPIELGWDRFDGQLTPRLDWFYRSEVWYQGRELLQAQQSGYNLLHGRLSYDFWEGQAQIAFWVQNLTDQRYFQQVLPTANTLGTLQRYYEPPRHVGVDLSYRF